MTTINCSSNCIHQEDGKCTLDHVTAESFTGASDCAFFHEKSPKSGQALASTK